MTTQTDLAQALRECIKRLQARITSHDKPGNRSVSSYPCNCNLCMDDRVLIINLRAALATHDRQREAGEVEPVAWRIEWTATVTKEPKRRYAETVKEVSRVCAELAGANPPMPASAIPLYEHPPASHPPGTHSEGARTASGVQTAVTSEAVAWNAWMIWFEDRDRQPIIVTGKGNEPIARAAFERFTQNWNCYLFHAIDGPTDSCARVPPFKRAAALGPQPVDDA